MTLSRAAILRTNSSAGLPSISIRAIASPPSWDRPRWKVAMLTPAAPNAGGAEPWRRRSDLMPETYGLHHVFDRFQEFRRMNISARVIPSRVDTE